MSGGSPYRLYFEIPLSVILKANPTGLFLSLIKVRFYILHMTFSTMSYLRRCHLFKGQPSILVAKGPVSVKLERLNFGAGDVFNMPLL